jgi:hypothetical protein
MRGSAGEGRNLHLRIYVDGIHNVEVESTYGKGVKATRQGANGEEFEPWQSRLDLENATFNTAMFSKWYNGLIDTT